MDVYDETPVPLPADLTERIEAEHANATIAVKLLLATIAVVLFDVDVAAHSANHVYAFLTLDEERRAQFVDAAGALTLRLENNGNGFERERAAVARPGLDFLRFEWPLYAYSGRRDHIVGRASTILAAVSPGWAAPDSMLGFPQAAPTQMTLTSLRAWLENPLPRSDLAADPAASAQRAFHHQRRWWIGVARDTRASIAAAMRRCATRAFGERRSWLPR